MVSSLLIVVVACALLITAAVSCGIGMVMRDKMMHTPQNMHAFNDRSPTHPHGRHAFAARGSLCTWPRTQKRHHRRDGHNNRTYDSDGYSDEESDDDLERGTYPASYSDQPSKRGRSRSRVRQRPNAPQTLTMRAAPNGPGYLMKGPDGAVTFLQATPTPPQQLIQPVDDPTPTGMAAFGLAAFSSSDPAETDERLR